MMMVVLKSTVGDTGARFVSGRNSDPQANFIFMLGGVTSGTSGQKFELLTRLMIRLPDPRFLVGFASNSNNRPLLPFAPSAFGLR